jgi:endonuclease/exonuclease/phosphatase (EEP) superfamily protein YafD
MRRGVPTGTRPGTEHERRRLATQGGDMFRQLLVSGLAALCIVMTIVPFHKDETWWVRACDFPRSQIAALIVATLAALAAFLELSGFNLALAFVLLLCLGAQLAVILPYTPLWPTEVRKAEMPAAPRTLSLLIVNVLMDNRAVDRLAEIISSNDPDIVLAVETDDWWCGRLQEALPGHPFQITHPLPNTYGMTLLSRLELIGPEVRSLLKPDVPSILTRVRLRSGDVVTLYGLHPEPPAPGEADTSLPRDAELVLAGREIAERGAPTIVAGDFNDVAWSHTSRLFRRISRLLDPRIGRGMYNTFHAGYLLLRWPLDHVFVGDAFVLRRMARLPGFGSDHFPIYIALDYAPAAGAEQEAPEADADDHAEARDKIERAGAEES